LLFGRIFVSTQLDSSAMTLPIIPEFLETKSIEVTALADTSFSNSFNVQAQHFAQLASGEALNTLMPNLIKVYIGDELNMMSAEHQLEISVPVLGLTDLLPNNGLHVSDLQFAAPMAINGWGAPEDSVDMSYLYPEHILATDIVGNQYEIIIDEHGQIQLPSEGTGLFSMLSYLTFMYGDWQVKQGHGLGSVSEFGAEPEFLYLLPPASTKSFEPKIALTQLDENYSRVVDTIRSIKVDFSPNKAILDVDLSLPKGNEHQLDISLDLSKLGNLQSDMSIELNILDMQNNAFSLSHPNSPIALTESQGWFHDTKSDSYIKPLGISSEAKAAIIRDVLSEYDITKGMLQGDNLGISNKNNYNDFLIYPEAIGIVYDQLTEGLAHNTIGSDFLWQRVEMENVLEFDFNTIDLSAQDSLALHSATDANSAGFSAEILKSLLEPIDTSDIQSHLSLFSEQPILGMPKVQAQVSDEIFESVLDRHSNFDQILTHDIEEGERHSILHANISNQETDMTLSFEDVMDSPLQMQTNVGNSVAQDLSVLLDSGVTNLSTSLDVSFGASDIVVTSMPQYTTQVSTELHFTFTQEPDI